MSICFNQEANLDEGAMWPIAFALKELTAAEEDLCAREESGELIQAGKDSRLARRVDDWS